MASLARVSPFAAYRCVAATTKPHLLASDMRFAAIETLRSAHGAHPAATRAAAERSGSKDVVDAADEAGATGEWTPEDVDAVDAARAEAEAEKEATRVRARGAEDVARVESEAEAEAAAAAMRDGASRRGGHRRARESWARDGDGDDFEAGGGRLRRRRGRRRTLRLGLTFGWVLAVDRARVSRRSPTPVSRRSPTSVSRRSPTSVSRRSPTSVSRRSPTPTSRLT